MEMAKPKMRVERLLLASTTLRRHVELPKLRNRLLAMTKPRKHVERWELRYRLLLASVVLQAGEHSWCIAVGDQAWRTDPHPHRRADLSVFVAYVLLLQEQQAEKLSLSQKAVLCPDDAPPPYTKGLCAPQLEEPLSGLKAPLPDAAPGHSHPHAQFPAQS